MHVHSRLFKQLLRYFKANQCLSRQTNNSKSRKSKTQVSKIKQTIKNIITQSVKTIGKTIAAAIFTSIIVIATDLINVANASRPEFAIGGEWLMIIFIFIGWIFIIDWILGKKRKPLTTK